MVQARDSIVGSDHKDRQRMSITKPYSKAKSEYDRERKVERREGWVRWISEARCVTRIHEV